MHTCRCVYTCAITQMPTCMYTCAHVLTRARARALGHMQTSVRAHALGTHVHMLSHACTHACTHMRAGMYMHVLSHVHRCTHACTFIYTCTHVHSHMHVNAHTHTPICLSSLLSLLIEHCREPGHRPYWGVPLGQLLPKGKRTRFLPFNLDLFLSQTQRYFLSPKQSPLEKSWKLVSP